MLQASKPKITVNDVLKVRQVENL